MSLKNSKNKFILSSKDVINFYRVTLNNTLQTVHCILKKKYINQYSTKIQNFLFFPNAWGLHCAMDLTRKTQIKTHDPEPGEHHEP